MKGKNVMKRIINFFIQPGIITLALFLLTARASLPQSLLNNSGDNIVDNVNYTVSNGTVYVTYNLFGESDQLYKISLILKRESDKDMAYVPRAVSGDIGEGNFAGQNRQIIWEMKNDFPDGLVGDDFYFAVQAEEINESSNILMWAGVGVAAAAAALAYIIVGGESESSGGNSSGSFPDPPGRP